MRVRVSGGALAERLRVPYWVAVGGLSVVAGAAVATFPRAAGNGMEALRHASLGATAAIGVALLVGKFIGTMASLGAGAPGGVLTPTISITSGAALLTLLAAEPPRPRRAARVGRDGGCHGDRGRRRAALAAHGRGVAPGDGGELLARAGDRARGGAAAVSIDRAIDALLVRRGRRLPSGVYDEDA